MDSHQLFLRSLFVNYSLALATKGIFLYQKLFHALFPYFSPNYALPLLLELTQYLVYKNLSTFCWTIKFKNKWTLTFTDQTNHCQRSLIKDHVITKIIYHYGVERTLCLNLNIKKVLVKSLTSKTHEFCH